MSDLLRRVVERNLIRLIDRATHWRPIVSSGENSFSEVCLVDNKPGTLMRNACRHGHLFFQSTFHGT